MNKPIQALKNGGTILYPTDTIWGIGCDATDEKACQKILEIKQRPENKSFIILVDNFAMLERYIPEFQEVCYDLADFASKPLTIIYPKAKGLAPSILAKDGSVGIRVTNDPICQKLIRSIRKPIVSTSANLSGEKNPTCFDEINEAIKSGVDAIVEERLFDKMEKASQIVKVGIDGKVEVLRR
ncbi:MAG: threonylcarbamoyl-AMP synthase [Fluviicola sp.]|nr:threonylcarbamoyl-AMP synthase [Fluviicola sp.]